MIAAAVTLSFPAFVSPYAAEETEVVTEAESETEPDPRTLWYMDHIPSLPQGSDDLISDSGVTAPDKLAKYSQLAPEKRSKKLRKIRKKLARYLNETYGIILTETFPVHYILTDDLDYVVTTLGETTYLYEVSYTKKGNPQIDEPGVDEATRQRLLTIAAQSPGKTDVHYWNQIITSKEEALAYASLPINEEGARAVPYFNQGLGVWDGTNGWVLTEWPECTFAINNHTMHEAGCGFFAAAMAISYLKQEIVSPIDFKENGQYSGDGAYVTVGLESAAQYGIEAVITGSWEEAYAALKEGHLVMENVGPGIFARYGHFILLTGIMPNGNIVVNDPGNEFHTYWYTWESFEPYQFKDSQHDEDTAFTIFG